MSKIIALVYADKSIPAEIYEEVRHLQSEGRLELIDVTEVEIKDNGKLKFERSMSSPIVGHTEGTFLPSLVGLLFFNPQHSVNDAVKKTLAEIAFDPNFVNSIATEVSPRNSVMFLYTQDDVSQGTLGLISQHGGRILQMSLSGFQEERLERLFRGHHFEHQETTMHSP
ncbi:DUF1269 domain-containing protein [Bdellovibrio sp. HCB337]|uniref:DUF1269 domain-containing protein n=1 Tax=Bdellovibrio sp. HCB337 TaxID=3394358 RepID=UPI0039A4B56E